MKSLFAAIPVSAALLLWATPAPAQMYPVPATPQPMQGYYSGLWPEMIDNGSSSDFPTHGPTDHMAGQLNRQVLDFNALSPPIR